MIIMKVSFKFCGGCNPNYDRLKALDNLIKKHPEWEVNYDYENNCNDKCIVICGCKRACADISKIKAKQVIVVDNEKLLSEL